MKDRLIIFYVQKELNCVSFIFYELLPKFNLQLKKPNILYKISGCDQQWGTETEWLAGEVPAGPSSSSRPPSPTAAQDSRVTGTLLSYFEIEKHGTYTVWYPYLTVQKHKFFSAFTQTTDNQEVYILRK